MNVENILAVADAIESASIPNLGFNMNYLRTYVSRDRDTDRSGRGCGTVACIAGWACAVQGSHPSFTLAAEFLGIDDGGDQNRLFYASNHPDAVSEYCGEPIDEEDRTGPLEEITPAQAVRTLRHLAATGTVDWTV